MTNDTLSRGRRATLRASLAVSTILAGWAVPALADDPPTLNDIVITAPKISVPAEAKTNAGGDTARLLGDIPGLSLIPNGGVSSLPAIHGLADDRLKLLVDGMLVTAACPNHMNPALSYVDPSKVEKLDVWAGITPVSAGGDSIGGTISAKSAPPVFAQPGEGYHVGGSLSAFYRSVNDGVGGSAAVNGANETFSVGYTGSWAKGRDYYAGGDHTAVLGTLYESRNHAVTAAAQHEGQKLTLQAGQQFIPYEGFANQRMDLTGNRGNTLNGGYQGEFSWGKLEGRAYWQAVKHSMDILQSERSGAMPMKTKSIDAGYAIKAEIAVSKDDTIRIGNEIHRFMLDDWWPPVAGSMMMGPNAYTNIRNGRRDVVGTFAEWEQAWSPQWTTLLGVRNDTVLMNASTVTAYGTSGMNAAEAANARTFNSLDHHRTDSNFDLTALVRWDPDATDSHELGFARKSRSPSLYERYAWGKGQMDSSMINWFGDVNSYVGTVSLRPEVAHTVSATYGRHDAERKDWSLKATPYYTYVVDYIGVDFVQNFTSNGGTYPLLKFANHDAMLYGIDFSGDTRVWSSPDTGDVNLGGLIGFVRGQEVNTGKGLYHVMPINAKATVEHRLDGWKSAVDLRLVGAKTQVDPLRNEPRTPGYALINLRTGYEWQAIEVSFGIDNLFDRRYYEPLGGVDQVEWSRHSIQGQVGALPAPGRSFNTGVTVKF